jgi:DNA-binding GntR family transcriptional regulator
MIELVRYTIVANGKAVYKTFFEYRCPRSEFKEIQSMIAEANYTETINVLCAFRIVPSDEDMYKEFNAWEKEITTEELFWDWLKNPNQTLKQIAEKFDTSIIVVRRAIEKGLKERS